MKKIANNGENKRVGAAVKLSAQETVEADTGTLRWVDELSTKMDEL